MTFGTRRRTTLRTTLWTTWRTTSVACDAGIRPRHRLHISSGSCAEEAFTGAGWTVRFGPPPPPLTPSRLPTPPGCGALPGFLPFPVSAVETLLLGHHLSTGHEFLRFLERRRVPLLLAVFVDDGLEQIPVLDEVLDLHPLPDVASPGRLELSVQGNRRTATIGALARSCRRRSDVPPERFPARETDMRVQISRIVQPRKAPPGSHRRERTCFRDREPSERAAALADVCGLQRGTPNPAQSCGANHAMLGDTHDSCGSHVRSDSGILRPWWSPEITSID